MADISPIPTLSPLAAAFAGPEARPLEGFWHGAYIRLRRNRLAFIAAIYLMALLVVAVVGPYLLPYRYDQQQYESVRSGASPTTVNNTGAFVRLRMISIVRSADSM